MPVIGSTIHRFERLASTNDTARGMAASGAAEGTVILASEQTAGRGRHGRAWASPAGQGLYFSAILRPAVSPSDLTFITLGAAVAVAEAIETEFGIKPDIKWPNDVMLSGKKVCGILVESAIEAASVGYAVLGIGINVAQKAFPPEIADTATSLAIEAGAALAPVDLLPVLLGRLEMWYRRSISSPENVLARWEEMSSYARQCPVRFVTSDRTLEGVTQGLSSKGALIVQTTDGLTHELFSGEVTLRKA